MLLKQLCERPIVKCRQGVVAEIKVARRRRQSRRRIAETFRSALGDPFDGITYAWYGAGIDDDSMCGWQQGRSNREQYS